MIDTFLVHEKTVVNAKGDGLVLDVFGTANRVFLLTLDITNIIEQEALDVSVYGSADGAAWGGAGLRRDCASGVSPARWPLSWGPPTECKRKAARDSASSNDGCANH